MKECVRIQPRNSRLNKFLKINNGDDSSFEVIMLQTTVAKQATILGRGYVTVHFKNL